MPIRLKRGNTWHFGYKAYIGVDKDSGLVHTVEATAANVHDVAEVPKLLTGEEEAVYGDSGYLGAGKREDAVVRNKAGRKIKYKINRRPSQMKKLSKSGQYAAKRAEHTKSSVRAKVEHVFGVVKKQLRFRKTRYRGLESVRLCGQKFNGYPQFLLGTYCIMRFLVFIRCCHRISENADISTVCWQSARDRIVPMT